MNKNKVLQDISEMHEEGDKATLYLHVDQNEAVVQVACKGDVRLLAEAFRVKMDNSEEFNRLMTSMFGAYLASNPAQQEAFVSGLNLSSFNTSIN